MPRSGFARRPRTFTGRLILWHATGVLGVLLVLGVVVDRLLERYLVEQITRSLAAEARLVQEALSDGAPDRLQSDVIGLGEALGARITIIASDGRVLADSESDPATMDNHLGRPEVREAVRGRLGVATRASATVGIPYRYVALPPRGGSVVRVALPLEAVRSRVATVRLVLAAGFGVAALAGLLALAAIARGVSRPLRRLTESVRDQAGPDVPDVPEEGTEELRSLARTVNEMRREVASRVEALQRDRRVRDVILSTLQEGIVLFDRQGAVRYRNREAERTLGGPVDDIRRLAPRALREVVVSAMEGGPGGPVEIAAEGPARVLLATAVSLPDAGSVMLALRDVTEPKRLERIRREFVANASHELKTPVAAIQALAETIATASAEDPDATRRFAEQLEGEAVRLSRIIADLLDLSRLEGGPVAASRARLDEVVEEEVRRSEPSARSAGVSLSVVLNGPVTVEGSARDLSLMARNLIENAIRYTRAGGKVDVAVGTQEGDAFVDVRDTGIGIPAMDRSRIFERFYRVDRARSRATGGTGLGLSIVKHVAENHGGTVGVESELARGSTFTVRLPLARSAEAAPS